MPSVLKIRDGNGNFIPINAIRGDRGKSAYEQAKEGGYTGTEEEFIQLLNGLTLTMASEHISNTNNPHEVTAEQTGGVSNTEFNNKVTEFNAALTEINENIGQLKNSDDTANEQLNELKEDVKELGERETPIPSYLAFVGNVNANIVSAAFGKGNEDAMPAVGKALAMYANFKDETNPTDFMTTYDKYLDLVMDHKVDLIKTPTVWNLINGNSYAKTLVKETNTGLPDIVVYDSGNSDYLDLDNITTNFTQADTSQNANNCSINIENGNIRMRLNVRYATSQWAGFNIPILNALPSLKGYRYLHVKLADTPASYLNGYTASNPETVKVLLTLNGTQRTLWYVNDGKESVYGNKYITGQTYTEDCFDLNVTDSTSKTMQFNLAFTSGIANEYLIPWADVSVKKIWFSES